MRRRPSPAVPRRGFMSVLTASQLMTWRTPAMILACGAVVSALSFGPRSTLGLFLTPMSVANGWGRDVFGLALALQMLLWGAGQPIAGAIADRYGAARVLIGGTLLYAIGLILMAYGGGSPGMLYLSAGVLVGFGLSGSGFQVVLGAFAKLMPAQWRSFSFGIGTAAGSFGQFAFAPLAIALIGGFDWQVALVIFAVMVLVILPAAVPLATASMNPKDAAAISQQSLKQSLTEAFAQRSYVLLVIGFFTCGFQLFFITVHLPAYLVDRGLSGAVGGWTLAAIGLFNIIGSLGAGWLSDKMPKRYILSIIYFARSLAIIAFIMLPASAGIRGRLRRRHGPALAFHRAADQRHDRRDVRHALAGDARRCCLLQPPGRRLPRRLARRRLVRAHRLIRRGVVGLRSCFGVISALINLPIVEKPVARMAAAPALMCLTFKAIVVEKTDAGQKRRPEGFRRNRPDGRRRHLPRRILHTELQGRPRGHRQSAGRAPLPDDRRHRSCRHRGVLTRILPGSRATRRSSTAGVWARPILAPTPRRRASKAIGWCRCRKA